MQKNVRQVVLPVLAAAIWGSAFVFQNMVADSIGPFTFNAARSAVAAVFLLLLYWALQRRRREKQPRGKLVLGCLTCGLALCLATNLQQVGIADTTAGKAGFITAMYMVLVPVFGLLLRKRVRPIVWCSVALAARGCTCPPEFPVCICGKKPRVRLVTRKPIVPGAAELEENPRARSAKLRVAEKLP